MGFSIRIAPGVRVRASSRGVRTSIGPRIARVHVGAGRAGVSTGIGPIGYYTSIGGGSRGRSSAGGTRRAGATLMTAAQADKLQRAQALGQALLAITKLHEEEFALAQRPVAPPPQPVDLAVTRKVFIEAALKEISIFQRSKRRSARMDAETQAASAVERETLRRLAAHEDEQAQLDRVWAEILANDPDAVMTQLASAFEDNAAPAAPLAVVGGEATLTVLIPDESLLPSQMPGRTDAGNVSIRKMTKKQHDELYALLVCGYILATVKEAFAVAPGLASIRIVAVRGTGQSTYGVKRGEAIAAAVIHRQALIGVRWASVDSRTVLQDVSSELLLNERGANRAFNALDLSHEDGLAELMNVIDFDELGED